MKFIDYSFVVSVDIGCNLDNHFVPSVYILCCCCLVAKSCPTFVTPWTVAHQAPLSGISPVRILERVAIFLLQGIFLTEGSNPCLLHWQVDSLPLSHQGSPYPVYSLGVKQHNQFLKVVRDKCPQIQLI